MAKNKKLFVAFTHEQPNDQITKEFSNVFFAFADDENHLHFGARPKKSYLLTPAQAANVIFSERTAGTRVTIFHCIDITKKELKTLRKEFKKQGFMPFEFFEKVMLFDKYFPDATVVLRVEPEAENETNSPIIDDGHSDRAQINKVIAADFSDKCRQERKAFCIRYFDSENNSVFHYEGINQSVPKLYRTFEDADFAAYEQKLRTDGVDWEAIEY
jgi:hypothetical protein